MGREFKVLNTLKIRADYEKALCSFQVSTEKGLGVSEDLVHKNDKSKELTSAVYTSELTGRKDIDGVYDPCCLCGFEGYTDELGEISTIRPLVLV